MGDRVEDQPVELEQSHQELIARVLSEVPLAQLREILSEELWVKEVLKDVDSRIPSVRTKALELWGKYLGLLQQKSKAGSKIKEVEFID